MRKLIASDLDGTLLRPGTILSDVAIAGIESLKRRKASIAIASGRTFEEISAICKPLSLFEYEHAYWIGYNGVEVRKADTGAVVYGVRFGWDVVKTVWERVRAMGMHMHVFTDHAVYLTKGIRETLHIVRDGWRVTEIDMESFSTTEPVLKIVVLDTPQQCDRLRASLDDTVLSLTSAFKSADMLVEFVPKGGTKGDALKALADHLAIDRSDVYAFGDEENDRTMLAYAGHGIAMKNAKPVILNMGLEITESNAQDGVVLALKRHGIID